MKNKYLLVWEDDNHETHTKESDSIDTLYRYRLQNSITGDIYKQIQVVVKEK